MSAQKGCSKQGRPGGCKMLFRGLTPVFPAAGESNQDRGALTLNSTEYPLFAPPAHLSAKGRKNWTAREAKEYRDWLLGVFDDRIKSLITRLGVPFGDTPTEHLLSVGERAKTLLLGAPFSEESPGGRKLTNLGYALAADLGLLVAKYLLDRAGDVLRWEIIRKPKSELSYNLPVLEGFGFNYLDPIGGSTAEASAVLRGQRGADAWQRIYEFWLKKAQREGERGQPSR